MNLNWFESILYGLFSGLTDILTVSAQAHKTLMLKIFGRSGSMELLNLLVHMAVAAALYSACRSALVRMNRARKLSLVPKSKRKRPLDVRSLMDLSMVRTMLVPVVLGLLFFRKADAMKSNLILLALFLFLNGLALYIPQYLPGGNRDSRTLSRVEGLCMGLGGAVSILPGFSSTGLISSVASVCGVDKSYGFNMTCLACMILMAGKIVYDVLAIVAAGLSFLSLVSYVLAGIAAFGGSYLVIRVLRSMAAGRGFGIFAFYCWGMALFTFILYLAT